MDMQAQASRTRHEQWIEAGIRSVAEALFPDNDYGAPDWRQTDLVNEMLSYMGELPPRAELQLKILFTVVELGAPLLVPCRGRFSSLSIAKRTAVIDSWLKSRVLVFNLLGQALKATLTMIYMSHPAVSAHLGLFKTCDRPGDPAGIEIRSETILADMLARAEGATP